MSFGHPHYLLLLLLAWPFYGWLRAGGSPVLVALRLALAVLAVCILARPFVSLQEEGLDLVVVADRSASVGADGLAEQQELLQLLGRSRPKNDRITVITFAGSAHVQTQGEAGGVSLHLDSPDDPNGSNLAGALALVRPSRYRHTRVAILSDGLHTGGDPLDPELLASLGGHEIRCRHVGRTRAGDVAAAAISLPAAVERGAGFLVRFAIHSSARREARYTLTRGVRVLAEGTTVLAAGMNHFVARDLADEPGQLEYRLDVHAPQDPEPGNNTCTGLVHVRSAPRVLLATTHTEGGQIGRILGAAGIPVDVAVGGVMDWSAAHLAPYRVVILENIPLDRLGPDGAKALADAVSHGVCGLLVTGGQASYGQGGYHKSAIDPLLPVTMELRQEQRRGLLALVTVLDRSGSMTASAGSGKTKMDLANLGTIEAIRMLSPMDQVAVLAVDSSPHTIIPLVQADDTAELCRAVSRIQSMGGGIFVRTGLEGAAAEIRKSTIPTRQIILFSDAADSEEQDGCLDLARKLVGEGIGISVVALGTKANSDARFLEDLAAAGKGEIYFTDRATELPRLFSQEVVRVSRRGFVTEPTDAAILPDMIRLGVPLDGSAPAVSGYNLGSLRPDASCALMTTDEYKSPLVAFWQHGRASVAAVTLELDGPHTGALAGWRHFSPLVVNLVRQIASGVTAHAAATWSQGVYGEALVRMEVEEKVAHGLRARSLTATFLAPEGAETLEAPLVWESPTEAVARVTLTHPGHYLPVIDLGDEGVVRAAPVSLPYSPEFMPRTGLTGEQVLRSLEAATGGRPIVKVNELFEPMEEELLSARKDIGFPLVLLFLLLAVAEIAERRLAWVDWIRARRKRSLR